jgi:transposase
MMGKKAEEATKQVEMVCLDQLVPREHMVRKLKGAIDLSFIYEEVEDLYANYGTVSIDPVVLIKLNIIQYVFGIRSMRQTLKEAEVNTAYRRYPGYGMMEQLPHFQRSARITRGNSGSPTYSRRYSRKY